MLDVVIENHYYDVWKVKIINLEHSEVIDEYDVFLYGYDTTKNVTSTLQFLPLKVISLPVIHNCVSSYFRFAK